ncbi:MAG: alpha/beta hydrolase [Planctomycetota bacterium]
MIGIALGVGLVAVAWALAPRLHRFAYWIARSDRAALAALATDGWERVVLQPDAGVELVGLVRPPGAGAADRTWILFLPGNAEHIARAFRPVLDGVLAGRPERGALLVPWRGFDASTGTPSPQGLLADARAVWHHLTQGRGVAAADIELWGYSLGSGLAVQLAAELCAAGTPPRRLVLLSAFDRIPVMRHGAFGRLLPGDVYDAVTAAPAVTCDAVLLHGTADDALPIEGARALRRALGGRSQWIELPGRGHVDYLAELGTLVP